MPDVVCESKPPVDSRLPLSISRPVARHRCERSEVHQHRPIPVEHDDALTGKVHREPEANRGGEPHRVLQIKEVLFVPEVVKFLRAGAHDGDDELVIELRIQHADAFRTFHHASSIRSRVRSSATGERALWENV